MLRNLVVVILKQGSWTPRSIVELQHVYEVPQWQINRVSRHCCTPHCSLVSEESPVQRKGLSTNRGQISVLIQLLTCTVTLDKSLSSLWPGFLILPKEILALSTSKCGGDEMRKYWWKCSATVKRLSFLSFLKSPLDADKNPVWGWFLSTRKEQQMSKKSKYSCN